MSFIGDSIVHVRFVEVTCDSHLSLLQKSLQRPGSFLLLLQRYFWSCDECAKSLWVPHLLHGDVLEAGLGHLHEGARGMGLWYMHTYMLTYIHTYIADHGVCDDCFFGLQVTARTSVTCMLSTPLTMLS